VAVIERLIERHGVDFIVVPPDASLQEVLRLAAAAHPDNPSSVLAVLRQAGSVYWIRAAEVVTFLDWTGIGGLTVPVTALPIRVTDRIILTSDPTPTNEIVEDLTSIEGQIFVIQDEDAQPHIVGVLYSPSMSRGSIDFGAANLRGIFGDTPQIFVEKRAKETECPHCHQLNFPSYDLAMHIWVCPACRQKRDLR